MFRSSVALACLLLAGCVESPVPLESGDKVSDPRLVGTWKTDFDGDPMVATIRQEAGGKLVADVQAYSEPGPKAATTRYEIVLAQFGAQRFMSIREPKLSPGYLLARYVFEGRNRFCLHNVPSEALAKDLEEKKLSAEIVDDRHMPHVKLAASQDQLRRYFATDGARAFHEMPLMAFERAAGAVLPPPRTQQERDRDPSGFNEVAPCREE